MLAASLIPLWTKYVESKGNIDLEEEEERKKVDNSILERSGRKGIYRRKEWGQM